MSKLSKSLVLYVFQPGSSYCCSECCYYQDEKCSQYKAGDNKVVPTASCNLWDLKTISSKGSGNKTKEDTGYVDNRVGYSCGRCKYFSADVDRCKEVSEFGTPNPGTISPRACCSNWEKDPVRGDMPEKILRSMKNYR